MQFKTSMKMIAGAVTLALSSHVFAQNVVGNGDIYIAIDDTTSSTEYLYDTGVSASTFTGGSVSSVDLTATQGGSGTAFTSFLGSLKSGTSLTNTTDSITYSVFAGTGASGNTSSYTDLIGSVDGLNGSGTAGASSGANISAAFQDLIEVLGGNNAGSVTANTFSGSEYLPATAVASQWFGAGHETNVDDDLVAEDFPSYGTAVGFYSETTTKPNSTKVAGTASTFAGTWDLSTINGDTVLAYTPSVPLPAPLLLLVSGLGMMGVFGRRRSGTAA
jgi:hypothetical protein